MSSEPPVFGAVLCGGSSRRMGTDKALVDVAGRPMAARVAEALSAAGAGPVVAVGGDRGPLGDLGLKVIADRIPGGGPVPALATAAEAALDRGAERLLVAGCDHPWLDAATLRALVAALGAAAGGPGPSAAVAGGVWPPPLVLAAAARPLGEAAGRTGSGASLGDLLTAMSTARVEGLAGRAIADVDRPGDLDR